MKRTWRSWVKTSVVVSGLLLAPGVAHAAESPRLLQADARVAGLSYTQWDTDWGRMQAVTPLRARTALALSRGGRRCGVQVGDVRLLPVSIRPGRQLTVRCTIRSNTFLAFPVTGYVEFGESRIGLAPVRQGFRAIQRAQLTINGRALSKPGRVVTTPSYRVVLPSPNGFGVPPGPEWLRSRDYFAILSPPSPGKHVITSLGVVDPPGEQAEFSIGIRYRITVR
jgi:hypothetical protein